MSAPDRSVETDGIGASLMSVVCAWCKKPLGAKVCVPSMAGQVSHGICEGCRVIVAGSLKSLPSPQAELPPGEASLFLPGAGRYNPSVEVGDDLPAPPVRPLFWTVTGNDFGRSIAWAKCHPNQVSEHIRAAIAARGSR